LNYNRTIREPTEGRPIDALLAGYAAKTLVPPLAALVAAHLELKPDNRAYVAALDAVHGVLLAELKPVPLAGRDRRLVNIFATPDPDRAPPPAPPSIDAKAAVLPRALRRLAGCDLAELPWRKRGSSIKEVVLPESSAQARFIRVRPGVRLPMMSGDGMITALVLAGAASDGTARYERGDIIFAGPDLAGVPTADGEQECVCFVVAETSVPPPGPLSHLLHRMTGG
jgi:putative transcriptional regulator